ncbi:MAG: L-histidine N(alpha)-methyltransferase [Crocinitomix sp.]|nr:L-histidine N(alpha)-methyltransferase [Crocinitomix sp.]
MIEQFKKDIAQGLSSNPKTLPSKYFYDEMGDELFVQIMHCPEYYLTKAELDIFTNQTENIVNALELSPHTYFELIELGAGDGLKTKELLKLLDKQDFKFDYLPIDISQNALNQLEESINKEFPTISVKTQQGDYFQVLETLHDSNHPKIVLFLGSNLGNMQDEIASDFINKLGSCLSNGDKLFLGVDLIKSASIVLPAYNDSKGITRDFNLNLLSIINRELEADFDLNSFSHQPQYTEKEGIAKSFLVSNRKQIVKIKTINQTFSFEKGEKIATEVSRKYNDTILNQIIENTPFQIGIKLTDARLFFANYVLKIN